MKPIRNAKKPIENMKDVAERAGVALSTVSRALSRPDLVSAETRKLVARTVEELGYTVNAATSSLRGERTGVVLVLIPDVSNPFVGMVLKGVQKRAREVGYSVLIGDDGDDRELGTSYARQVAARRADGIILLTGTRPQSGASALKEAGLRSRVVAISEGVGEAVPPVGVDNVRAAMGAVAYLVSMGHRRIMHFAGPRGGKLTRDRLAGYQLALAEADVPFDGELVRYCDFTAAAGHGAAGALAALPERPTALFAASDHIAIGAMSGLRDRGLSVPADVSVVGFDDVDSGPVACPALTTVHQPRLDMGFIAMSMLMEMLDGSTLVHDRILPTRFVVRDSVRRLGEPLGLVPTP